ncbi:unnamed protein product [marine sediment metagenome]|uniref:Two component regulator three Y domain-containing protein n=1 Tax=marine sediment metagenome TaxID=412755 RepID=X0ZQN9_9ZZZZ
MIISRVHLRTIDGKYHTVYADINGSVQFRIPTQKNETYNITITGHNLIPSNFNFKTYPDNDEPEFLGVTLRPEDPITSDNIYLTIEVEDEYSGIESIFLLFSNNKFHNYSTYKITNNFEENENSFTYNLGKLNPGEYSYSLVIRDYANNTKIVNMDNFEFTINKPIINYIFSISLGLIIGIVGVSIIIVYKGMQRYAEIIRKIEDKI